MAGSNRDDPERPQPQGHLRAVPSEPPPQPRGAPRSGAFLVPVEPRSSRENPAANTGEDAGHEAHARAEELRQAILALVRGEKKPLLYTLFAGCDAPDLMRDRPDEKAIRARYDRLCVQVTEAERAQGAVVKQAQVSAARRVLDRFEGHEADLAQRVWEEFEALQEKQLREKLDILAAHEDREVIPHTNLRQVQRVLEELGYDPDKATEHARRAGFRLEPAPAVEAPAVASTSPPQPLHTGQILAVFATLALAVVALVWAPWRDSTETNSTPDGATTLRPLVRARPDVVVVARPARRCELDPPPSFPDGEVLRDQGVALTRLDGGRAGVSWVDHERHAHGLTLDVHDHLAPVAAPSQGAGMRVHRALLTTGETSPVASWWLDTEEAVEAPPRLIRCGTRLAFTQAPPGAGESEVFWCCSVNVGAGSPLVLALQTQWDADERPITPAHFNVYFPRDAVPVRAWTYDLPNPASVLRTSDPMQALFVGYRPSEARAVQSPGGTLVVITRYDGRHYNFFYGWIDAEKHPLSERMTRIGTNLGRATKPDPTLVADDRGAVMIYPDRDTTTGRIGLRRVRFEPGQAASAPVSITGVEGTTESESNPSLARFSWGWLLTWTLGNDRVMFREYDVSFNPLGPPKPVRPAPSSDSGVVALDDQHFALVTMLGREPFVRRLLVRTGECSERPVSAPPVNPGALVTIPATSYSPLRLPAGRAPAAVEVPAFEIDRSEVNVRDYEACVAIGACPPVYPQDIPDGLSLCNTGDAHRLDRPINCVNAEQAELYCAWKGGRLPTETEWEYAFTGGRDINFPWGHEAPSPDRANGCWGECSTMLGDAAAEVTGRDAWETTAPVESFPLGASPFGVLHMADNVSEWVARTADARGGRIVRGGSWRATRADAMSIEARELRSAVTADPTIGFRCVHPRR